MILRVSPWPPPPVTHYEVWIRGEKCNLGGGEGGGVYVRLANVYDELT